MRKIFPISLKIFLIFYGLGEADARTFYEDIEMAL